MGLGCGMTRNESETDPLTQIATTTSSMQKWMKGLCV